MVFSTNHNTYSTPLLVTIVSFYSFTKIQGNQLTAPIAFTAITVFTELRSALNTLPETFVDILQALIRYVINAQYTPPKKKRDRQSKTNFIFTDY